MAWLPMPGQPGEALAKGIDTGSALFQRMMAPIISRENMARQWQQHQDNLAIQQAAAKRAEDLAPLQRRLAQLNIDKAERLSDPAKQMAYIKSILEGVHSLHGQPQGAQNSAMEMYHGMGMPSAEELENPTQVQAPSMQALQQGFSAFSPEEQLALSMAGIKVPSSVNSTLQGPAREAMDLERLKGMLPGGENHPVYQNALQTFKAKQQAQQDLSGIRGRQLGGLKPGERWLNDPQTGEVIGKETPLTATERGEAKGRGFFNNLFPTLSQGLNPFSGQGSIIKFANAAQNYGVDPTSTKLIDDYVLGQKLLTAGIVKEAATLATGKQKATYERLENSLDSSDIPKKVSTIIKMFGLPDSVAAKADKRFQQIINDATKAGEKSIPAYNKQYFNPQEWQAPAQQSSSNNNTQAGIVSMIDPEDGERYDVPAKDVEARRAEGWQNG